MNRALLTSDCAEWGTPRPFFEWLDLQFSFTIDACASPLNYKHPRYLTKKDNALAQSFEGETPFCNPPYGRTIGGFCELARDSAMYERALWVQLLPARVDTNWWNRYVLSSDRQAGRLLRSWYDDTTRVWWLRWEGLVTGIYHHDERLAFEGLEDAEVAPFPSSVVWHAHPSRRPAEVRGDWLTRGWPR